MAKYILLDSDNKVVNITEGDDSHTPPSGYTRIASVSGEIGDTYDPSDSSFTTPSVATVKSNKTYYLEASDADGRIEALAVACGVLFRDEDGDVPKDKDGNIL